MGTKIPLSDWIIVICDRGLSPTNGSHAGTWIIWGIGSGNLFHEFRLIWSLRLYFFMKMGSSHEWTRFPGL